MIRITGTLHEDLCTFILGSLLEWEVFQTEFVKTIKTHFLC
jgi:hypothetical protein